MITKSPLYSIHMHLQGFIELSGPAKLICLIPTPKFNIYKYICIIQSLLQQVSEEIN